MLTVGKYRIVLLLLVSNIILESTAQYSTSSTWPVFRYNRQNQGRTSQSFGSLTSDAQVWRFQTGGMIFSAPVIGSDLTVLFGSGDGVFYKIDADSGTAIWTFPTTGLIDSAAAVDPDENIYFGCGDGFVYALTNSGNQIWKFASHLTSDGNTKTCPPGLPADSRSGASTWFEGNVVISTDGRLLAGCDSDAIYAINKNGEEIFEFYTGLLDTDASVVWAAAATLADGTAIVAVFNGAIFKILPNGTCTGTTVLPTIPIPISSSPALSNDESFFVVGTWGGTIYAVNTLLLTPIWTYQTRAHIYGSAAIGIDNSVYIASTDGSMYALSSTGTLLWTWDTAQAIRSSPAIDGLGRMYFGGADGRFYCLNTTTGHRIWSYDTTTSTQNNLNSSPGLGQHRVYIGSQDNSLIGIPYDYCTDNQDIRCDTNPQNDILPANGAIIFYIPPNGQYNTTIIDLVQLGSVLSFKLIVRENGKTVSAGFKPLNFGGELQNLATGQKMTIAEAFTVVFLPGNAIVDLVPKHIFDFSTKYNLTITSKYNLTIIKIADYSQSFTFTTVSNATNHTTRYTNSSTTWVPAFNLYRLSPSVPDFLVSINQIGYSTYNFLGSIIHYHNDTKYVQWILGVGLDNSTIDPKTSTKFSASVQQYRNSFVWTGYDMTLITGGPTTYGDIIRVSSSYVNNVFGSYSNQSSILVQANCTSNTAIAADLTFFGYCPKPLVAVGSINANPWNGPANNKPANVQVTSVVMGLISITAYVTSSSYSATNHVATIVLINNSTGDVVPTDYLARSNSTNGSNQSLNTITLNILGLQLPQHILCVIVLDLFPICKVEFDKPLLLSALSTQTKACST